MSKTLIAYINPNGDDSDNFPDELIEIIKTNVEELLGHVIFDDGLTVHWDVEEERWENGKSLLDYRMNGTLLILEENFIVRRKNIA